MSDVINIHDAKTHFSRLLARVEAGEEIVIAKSGKPIARLVPLDHDKDRIAGIADGRVTDAFFEPLPDEELDRWS